jgi:GNAT superfamily N-acetyltransferase
MPDPDILRLAAQEHALLVTCDSDFRQLAIEARRPCAGVVLLRLEAVPLRGRAPIILQTLRATESNYITSTAFTFQTVWIWSLCHRKERVWHHSEEKTMTGADSPSVVEVQPASPDRWHDLETLFGERGAEAGCWCMFWRLGPTRFMQQSASEHKEALKAMFDDGQVPGLLLYGDGQVMGWCGIGPRETFPALDRSRIFKRVDEQPVWSIVCFYVAQPFRRKGVMRRLLTGALAYVKEHGARIVEGYPRDPAGSLPNARGYRGIASTFREVGFVEVGRASATQVTMRYIFD